MENLMMTPKQGQMVKSEELAFTGVVMEVLSYQEVYDGMHESSRGAEDARLLSELGADFKDRFFEVIVDVIEVADGSEYAPGEQAMLSWDEFQRASIL